jgi:hypothetical protein
MHRLLRLPYYAELSDQERQLALRRGTPSSVRDSVQGGAAPAVVAGELAVAAGTALHADRQ